MPTLRKVRALRSGGRIGIAAPAGPVDPERLAVGEELVRKAGFEVVRRDDLTDAAGYLAGSDERRAGELMALVADPEVDAVICARGGYGCHRVVPHLDAQVFRKAAKPLIGYSDITTLLLWQRRCAGLVGFHGPMLERADARASQGAQAWVRALMGTGALPHLEGKPVVGGWAEGRLTGGSLSLVVASLGTPWEIDTRDAILLLEEVNEAPFRIDRMLQQLHAAGKLATLVGVGIGALVDCSDARYPEPAAEQVIEEMLAPLEVPLLMGLPFGDCENNQAWPLGARAAIDGARGELELLETGVGR